MRPVRALSIVWLALVVLLATAAPARAQTVRSAPVVAAAASATADKSADIEAADSPRASMRAFLELCDRGRYEEAAHYLDVPHGAEKRAAELAHRLYDVLQERLWVDAERLSPLSHGKKEDALPPGT